MATCSSTLFHLLHPLSKKGSVCPPTREEKEKDDGDLTIGCKMIKRIMLHDMDVVVAGRRRSSTSSTHY